MDVQILAPTAGQDYPQTWNEFLDWFSTEDDCLAYLERLRWGDGFVCPKCGSIGEAYPPMATPNCSTYGRSNCSRQDGRIMTIRA